MCYGCWQKAGSPRLNHRQVRRAARLIAGVYEYSCAGGSLHEIVDDWNVENWTLKQAPAWIRDGQQRWPDEYPLERIRVERACLKALRGMTIRERYSALALYDGFWDES